jgi:hypothetical protein
MDWALIEVLPERTPEQNYVITLVLIPFVVLTFVGGSRFLTRTRLPAPKQPHQDMFVSPTWPIGLQAREDIWENRRLG